jgi:hypothetical protein
VHGPAPILPQGGGDFVLLKGLVSDGLLVLLGTYAFWVGGSFAVLYSDLQKNPPDPGGWSLWQWGLTCIAAGGLALPLYYWTAHNTGPALVRGIFLGFLIAVLTLAARMGLSLYLQVPLV